MSLSEIDQIRIRHLIEDHAGNLIHTSIDLGPADAVRYMTDIVQNTYSGLHPDTVAATVAEIIDADPTVLNNRTTERDRVAAELRRHTAAQVWLNEAAAVLKATEPGSPYSGDYGDDGPHPYAVACIDAAEREYPDMPSIGVVRETIAKRWRRWRVGRITGQALRVAQAGSQRRALELIEEGAKQFPDMVDWDAYRRKIREYHHLGVG